MTRSYYVSQWSGFFRSENKHRKYVTTFITGRHPPFLIRSALLQLVHILIRRRAFAFKFKLISIVCFSFQSKFLFVGLLTACRKGSGTLHQMCKKLSMHALASSGNKPKKEGETFLVSSFVSWYSKNPLYILCSLIVVVTASRD